MKNKVAVFPGSFNPFTIGHAEVVRLGLEVFDTIYILFSMNSGKDYNYKDIDDNVNRVEKFYSNEISAGRIKTIISYDLTANIVKEKNAVILRGLRTTADFEYEKSLANINRELGVETYFVICEPKFDYVSSSMVRELKKHNVDVSKYVV